jgi:hypothetical protein
MCKMYGQIDKIRKLACVSLAGTAKQNLTQQYTLFMAYCGYVVVIYFEEQFVSLLHCCHCLEET